MLAFNSTNTHDYYNFNHGYLYKNNLDFALSVLLLQLRKDYVFCKKSNKRFKNEFIDKKTQESYNLLMWKIKNGSQENIKSDKRYFDIRKQIFLQYEYLKIGKTSKYYLIKKRYFDRYFDDKKEVEVYHTCKNNIVINTHRFEYQRLTINRIVEDSILRKYSDVFIEWVISMNIYDEKILNKYNPSNIDIYCIGISKGADFYRKIIKICNLMQSKIDLKSFKNIAKLEKIDKYFR